MNDSTLPDATNSGIGCVQHDCPACRAREQQERERATANGLPVKEKGIPIPAGKRRPSLLAFFESLEVGDSFVVSLGQKNLVYSYAGKCRFKVEIRRTDEDPSQIRVWRVA
jgi:hypothetical protein